MSDPIQLDKQAQGLEVLMEVHAPGLDMYSHRMTYHRMFMGEVHDNLQWLSAQAWSGYREHGRGVLYVDKRQWMQIFRDVNRQAGDGIPFSYVPAEEHPDSTDMGPLRSMYDAIMRDYDPEKEFVMLVNQHPGDLLACYLIRRIGPSLPEDLAREVNDENATSHQMR